jgi:hypothetical protein
VELTACSPWVFVKGRAYSTRIEAAAHFYVGLKKNMKDPVREYCRKKGYADHVIQGGMRHLVESWEKVVQSLIDGGVQYYYDYLNDMDGRQILEEVVGVATIEQKTEYCDRIKAADRHFLSIVTPTDKCIWGDENAMERGWTKNTNWWYFHRPPNIDDQEWPPY